jgi:hypothetical protein
MPEIVADSSSPSCCHLSPGPGMQESQRLDPDLFLPRAGATPAVLPATRAAGGIPPGRQVCTTTKRRISLLIRCRLHNRRFFMQMLVADREHPRIELPTALRAPDRLLLLRPRQTIYPIVLAGLDPAIHEVRRTPCRFPWMPGTRACPQAARNADPWAGQDDYAEIGIICMHAGPAATGADEFRLLDSFHEAKVNACRFPAESGGAG